MLKTINNSNQDEILSRLIDKEIIVYEDVQGSKIFVDFDGEKFIIRPKSVNSEPLSFLDLAIQNYYNNALNYFNSLM